MEESSSEGEEFLEQTELVVIQLLLLHGQLCQCENTGQSSVTVSVQLRVGDRQQTYCTSDSGESVMRDDELLSEQLI